MNELTAQMPCSTCRDQIGRDGVYVSERVAFCRRCAARVKQVIEIEEGRHTKEGAFS